MEITIVGGFGFVGSSCADFFLKKGHDITIIARSIPDYLCNWSKDFNVIIEDVTNNNFSIEGDVVIHCASINETKNSSLEEFIKTNVIGTKNVIEACIKKSVERFVKMSTFHVYGNKTGVITENTPTEPQTNYGISQLLADELCKNYTDKVNISLLRFSNMFGPPIHPKIDRWTLVVNNFCMQAIKTGKIMLNSTGTQRRDFIAVNDAMGALNCVLNTKINSGEVFNVGGECVMSILDVANRIARNYKNKYNKNLEVFVGERIEPINDFTFSIKKIKDIGYLPKENIDNNINRLFDICETL